MKRWVPIPLALGLVLISSEAALAAACGNYTNKFVMAVSGTGNTVQGTAVGTTTPTQWSVDQASGSTWDEAAWLWDNTWPNPQPWTTYSIECGFYSGAWPYGGTPFTSNLYAYYTVSDGAVGVNYTGASFAPNTALGMFVLNGNYCHVGGVAFPTTYVVKRPPLTNYAHGEVTASTNTWMGGGYAPGESHDGYWTPGSGWYLWGFNNDCADPPYQYTHNNAHSWSDYGF